MRFARFITALVLFIASAAVSQRTLARPQQPQAAAPQAGTAAQGAPQEGERGAARGATPTAGARPTPPPPPPAVMPPPVEPIVSGTAPAPDPRVGLKAGRWDAGQA